jgi:hypothetical protein
MDKKEKITASFDLLGNSWKVYCQNLWKFIEVLLYGLAGVIPFFVVIMLIAAYGASGLAVKVSLSLNIFLAFLAVVAVIATLCLAIFYGTRSKIASILLLKNNFTTAKENFKQSTPYFWRFLGVSLLLVILVFSWGLLFVIPAFIFATYYGFCQYVLVAEDKRPFSSVERSYDLVKGYFWPTFGRMMLLIVIGIAIYLLLAWPLRYMAEASSSYFAYDVFMNLVWALLSPYFIIYPYQLYQSLREKNK